MQEAPKIETEWMRMTAAEVAARAEADAIVIVPVASMEQHGPHLATGVDIVLCSAVADRLASLLLSGGTPAVVTPCVWSGLAEHHMSIGGSVTLDYPALASILRGIVRSAARAGFHRVMLLNGHGGNAEAVALSATELAVELSIKVAAGTYWRLASEVVAPILDRQEELLHACEAETSMMLALRPDLVRLDRISEAYGPASTQVEGQPAALAMRRPYKAMTPSGVVGDARTATAEKGEALLTAITERIAEQLANKALWA
jgi:creatinine amidohydrolase